MATLTEIPKILNKLNPYFILDLSNLIIEYIGTKVYVLHNRLKRNNELKFTTLKEAIYKIIELSIYDEYEVHKFTKPLYDSKRKLWNLNNVRSCSFSYAQINEDILNIGIVDYNTNFFILSTKGLISCKPTNLKRFSFNMKNIDTYKYININYEPLDIFLKQINELKNTNKILVYEEKLK